MVVLALVQQWKSVRQLSGNAQYLPYLSWEAPAPAVHVRVQTIESRQPEHPPQQRGVLYVLWDELKAQNPDSSGNDTSTSTSTISTPTTSSTSTWNNLAKNTRVLANVVPRLSIIPQEAITMITHVSTSKLDTLIILQEFWGGPLSVALWIKSEQDIRDLYLFLSDSHRATPALLQSTSFHVWMEYQPEPLYPHNKLRNLALLHSDTDFFLTNDADFVTKPNSYQELMTLMKRTAPRTIPNTNTSDRKSFRKVDYDPRTAGHSTPLSFGEAMKHRSLFVLPAFARFMLPRAGKQVTANMLPRTKQELIDMKTNKLVTEFQGVKSVIQGPTQFHIWHANQTDWYYPIQYKTQYEPYVIGYKHGVPLYQEGFRGYGWNKQSWYVQFCIFRTFTSYRTSY
jgi:Glycosyl-transferase for dystroglycan